MSEFSTNFNFLQSQELKKREAMACEELFGLINHTIFKLFELDMQAKNQAPDDELYLLTTSLSFTKVINDEQKLQHTLGVVLYPDEESSSHIYKQAELLVPVDNRFNLSMSPLNLDERYDPKQVYIELERNDGKKERYVIDGRTNQILTFDYVDEPEKIVPHGDLAKREFALDQELWGSLAGTVAGGLLCVQFGRYG